MSARIAILDYGMGNLRSAEKALERVGAAPEITADHDRVRAADGVVLPGVGAFPRAMEAVRRLRLDALLHERRDAGVPIIGLCLGMQLLFESSSELAGGEGIGLLEGRVERIVGVDRLVVELALSQPHGAAAPDVHGRHQDHAAAPTQMSANEPSSLRPWGPDFSGWNWVP